MKKPHGLFSLCFAFALFFAQQGAVLHALSHLTEHFPAQQEKHLPHSTVCDDCVAYAGVGSAVATASFILALQQSIVIFAITLCAAWIPASFCAYRSRAPPFRT